MIVAAVRDEGPRSYWSARAALGAATTALIVFFSGPPLLSWPLLVGGVAGILMAFIANGEVLLQLSAEATGAIRKAPRPLRSKRRGDQVMAAGLIEPGAWICHYQEYEDLRSKARDENDRRRADHERQEDARIALVRSELEARQKAEPERVDHYYGDPSYELRRRPYPGWNHDPKKQFHLVVVAHGSADGQRVTFGFLRGAGRVARADEDFYVAHARVRNRIDTERIGDAAAALISLLDALISEGLPEGELIAVMQEHHSRDVIRRAIRGALATRLVRRRRGPVRLLCELLCVFRLMPEPVTERHRNPVITDLGRRWLEEQRVAKKTTTRYSGASAEKGEAMSGGEFNFYGGGQVFINSPVGSVTQNGSHEETHVHINQVLERVVETYESRGDLVQTAADREALEGAISQIRAVLEDGRPADSRIVPALKVITRIGEGLFLGVAGNALYDQLIHLIELLVKR